MTVGLLSAYLGALGLEQSINELEAPLTAAGLDVWVAGNGLLELVDLAHRQRGRPHLLHSSHSWLASGF